MSKLLKNLIENISSVLGLKSSALKELIKENKKYLEVEFDLAEKHDDAINALKEYSIVEDPSLSEALETLATAYKDIELARKEKVKQLEVKFINPLQELLEELLIKQNEINEAEKAKEGLDKAQKKLEKEDSKASDKKDPDKLEELKSALAIAKKQYENEDKEAQKAIEVFNNRRIAILKEILKNISEIEKDFYQKAVELTISVKLKAEDIEIKEEEQEEETNLEDHEEVENDKVEV